MQIINKPIVQDYAFKNEYVEQEIKNLKDMIESRVNDKVQYAVDKCFEECALMNLLVYSIMGVLKNWKNKRP